MIHNCTSPLKRSPYLRIFDASCGDLKDPRNTKNQERSKITVDLASFLFNLCFEEPNSEFSAQIWDQLRRLLLWLCLHRSLCQNFERPFRKLHLNCNRLPGVTNPAKAQQGVVGISRSSKPPHREVNAGIWNSGPGQVDVRWVNRTAVCGVSTAARREWNTILTCGWRVRKKLGNLDKFCAAIGKSERETTSWSTRLVEDRAGCTVVAA